MERFPDGVLVRLRSLEHGGYLHADEGGTGVSLSWGLKSPEMAWKVHRVLHYDGSTGLLLHSAAYSGRYLAASSDPAPPIPLGHRVFLGDCGDSIVWTAVESASVGGYVLLRHDSSRLLYAIIDSQHSRVSIVDDIGSQSRLLHWKVETIPNNPTAGPAAPMEQFTHGALVRLRSRVDGRHLHADEDGTAVSLRENLVTMNIAWRATRILQGGSISVRLQSAAHGRYLAASSEPAPPGHLGHRVATADCDLNVDRVLWEAVGSGDTGFVLLRHASGRRLLRANGRYGGVSVDFAGNYLDQSAVVQWMVERIPTPAALSPESDELMEQLPDGAYARLRSSGNGLYLRADEDGVGVHFRLDGGSLNAAWRVHRVLHRGASRVLLQNAAYGRYLAYCRGLPNSVPMLVQSVYYNNIQQQDLLWEERSHPGGGVLLVNTDGVHLYPLMNPHDGTRTPLVMEIIHSRMGLAPGLSAASDEAGIFRRLVVYIQGDEYGNTDLSTASAIIFQGRSVSRLRAEIAERFPERIAICLWSGFLGRLIPLITDLPANNETVEVVIFDSWTRAALGLQYPLMDGE